MVHVNLVRLLAIAPLTLLLACGSKVASREDVRSGLVDSISLASESATFVKYIGDRHSTCNFASGHLQYLSKQVNRKTQDLSKLNASPDLANALNVDRVQLGLLRTQLENASQNIQRPDVLAASEQQIRKIQRALVQANSSL